jgi:putative phosphoesterase
MLDFTIAGIRVAILSDTHGFLDPRIARVVRSCDFAIHAGDIGGASVLRALLPRRNKIIAVRGNNDVPQKWSPAERSILDDLPAIAELDLPGGKIVVAHGERRGSGAARHIRLRRDYPYARAVVYGHSHRIVTDRSTLPWILNPGAAGRARTFGGPSCLVLTASSTSWRLRVFRFNGTARLTLPAARQLTRK